MSRLIVKGCTKAICSWTIWLTLVVTVTAGAGYWGWTSLARAQYTSPNATPNQENQAAKVTVAVDTTTVNLGDDLLITYTVTPSTASFDSVTVQIKNTGGTVVAEWTNQSGSSGPHNVTWSKAKWNTGSHSGAYANPKNGYYTVWAKGIKSSQVKEQDSKQVSTQLVVKADLVDDKPSSDEISSGLYQPSVGLSGSSSERIRVGLKPSSGDVIWATSSPAFSSIEKADLDNDSGDEVKKAHLEQTFQSDTADGTYAIVFDRLRDLAGNKGVDGSGDGVIANWTITLY